MMKALELNLASRPFRNNVPIWTAHAVFVAAVVAFSAWNVHTYFRAAQRLDDIEATMGSTERRMQDLEGREQAATTAARAFDLKTMTIQAEKANDILLRRGLSWTRLFNILEKIVPYEVRMTAIRPVYGTREASARGRDTTFEGTVPVDVEGTAQSLEAFLELERALIVDPHFADVEPIRSESQPGVNEVKFQLRFLYDPDGRLGGEHPSIPHVLDAAIKAAKEGGEAPPSALGNLQ